jgi:DNA-binding beta-propeller fold protein YncE
MNRSTMYTLALASACSERPADLPGPTAPDTTADTATSTGPPIDCDALPAGPFPTTTHNIQTTEDFDFDAEGLMVYQTYEALVGNDGLGGLEVLSGQIDSDARGVQVLSTGDVVVAGFQSGTLQRVDRATGGVEIAATDLGQPNGLEVSSDGLVYVASFGYGHVSTVQMDTGATTPIASGLGHPNGVTLSPDEQALYVADSRDGTYRIRREAGGTWGAPELIRAIADSQGDSVDGIEVDICGNVYLLGFSSGILVRIDPETLAETVLLELDPGGWNSMRWGSDRGIWRRDVLYLTDRTRIVGVELGVPGRAQPVDAVP